jgi:hypothetical protein
MADADFTVPGGGFWVHVFAFWDHIRPGKDWPLISQTIGNLLQLLIRPQESENYDISYVLEFVFNFNRPKNQNPVLIGMHNIYFYATCKLQNLPFKKKRFHIGPKSGMHNSGSLFFLLSTGF